MAQSHSNILVHIVFSTKDRFPFLNDLESRKRTHAYLARVFNEHQCHALEVGGTEDHVHILCNLSRNHSVSEIIEKAKSHSSSWIKTFGGRCAKFAWQAGYGAFSVDPAQMGPVRGYIRNQAEHHRKRTFQEEYVEILRRYNIAYDERYIWR